MRVLTLLRVVVVAFENAADILLAKNLARHIAKSVNNVLNS
jgi:hypothetical protein